MATAAKPTLEEKVQDLVQGMKKTEAYVKTLEQ